MKISDLHNHSTYSDGKNTIEEMVLSAIDYGYDVFGISDHGHTDFDESYCMIPEQYAYYMAEINRLKRKYQDRITILAGIEMDYYTDVIPEELDYVIGSVHYVKINDEYLTIDASEAEFQRNAEKYYEGDYLAFCRDYYQTVADVVRKTECDIVGHFDLIAKFNEDNRYFDETSKEYQALWQDALDKLLQQDCCFEINCGAYNRGLRSIPYLRPEMQQYIKDRGGRMIYSSDSHSVIHHIPREFIRKPQ